MSTKGTYGAGLSGTEVERLRVIFEHYDRNGDGKLDRAEFKNLLRDTFPRANPKELEEMMPMLDPHETKINFSEYINYMSEDISLRFQSRFINDQRRLWEDKLGLVLYLVFFAFFLFLTIDGMSQRGYFWMNSSVVRHLEEDHFQCSDDLRYRKLYEDVGEVEEFWEWQLWPMINTIWLEKNGAAGRGYHAINGVNYPIGALKIFQTRVPPDTVCPSSIQSVLDHAQGTYTSVTGESPAARKEQFGHLCYPEFVGTVDKNSMFSDTSANGSHVYMRAEHVRDAFEKEYVFPAYQHRDLHKNGGVDGTYWFFGKANWYQTDEGHGVILPFSYNRSTVLKILTTLRDGITVGGWNTTASSTPHPDKQVPWIDAGTRGLNIEFYTYNQNLDFAGKYQNFIEVTSAGMIIPLHYVTSFVFFDSTRYTGGYFVALAIFSLMVLAQCVSWVLYVVKHTKLRVAESGINGFVQHLIEGASVVLMDFWMPFDFINLLLFCTSLGMRYYWISLSFTSTSVLSMNAYPSTWDRVQELSSLQASIDSVNALLTFMRVFYYLKLNSRLNLLTATIERAAVALVGILFIFLIVFIGFAMMSHIVFGTMLEEYRSLGSTIASLMRMLLGDFEFDKMKEERRIMSPILFMIFNIVANFLLLNMVIAVLNQAFTDIRLEKYRPDTLGILLNTLHSDAPGEVSFVKKMKKQRKGFQNWFRGSSLWRELVYGSRMAILYMTSKKELSGGEVEWNQRYREICDYNPRTYWSRHEEMLYFTKRSFIFKDKLYCQPMPLKFFLLDQFGQDLERVLELSRNRGVAGTARGFEELRMHDLVVAPSYHLGANPRSQLIELVEFHHHWTTQHCPNYAEVVPDPNPEDEDGEDLVFLKDETPGYMSLRGSQKAEDFIANESEAWWARVDAMATVADDASSKDKHNEEEAGADEGEGLLAKSTLAATKLRDLVDDDEDDDRTKHERLRRAEEVERLEQQCERERLEEQHQYIANLQFAMDELHAPVAGKMCAGSFKITPSDIHVPTILTVSGCPLEDSCDPNGSYALKGTINTRPYWRKVNQSADEPKLCVMWGDGRWWIGAPRKFARDRVCVPTIASWRDTSSQLPPRGYSEQDTVACASSPAGSPVSTGYQASPMEDSTFAEITSNGVWETVVDGGNGGIGDPPVLTYDVAPDGKVETIHVSGACSRRGRNEGVLEAKPEVNGRYTLQTYLQNGKPVWRKRYQVVRRFFKVEPIGKETNGAKIRVVLREIRDSIRDKYNVALRVPGVKADRTRRMELEGDWHMVQMALAEVTEHARETHMHWDSDTPVDEVLPEVFYDESDYEKLRSQKYNCQELEEKVRLQKLDAVRSPSHPDEWLTIGKGFDFDISWKGGRWTIDARLLKAKNSYTSFRDAPPMAVLYLYVTPHSGGYRRFLSSRRGSKAMTRDEQEEAGWPAFVEGLPSIMEEFAGDTADLADPDNTMEKINKRVLMTASCKPHGHASWHTQRPEELKRGGEDTLLYEVTFQEEFSHEHFLKRTKNKSEKIPAEVLYTTGKLKGRWFPCMVGKSENKDVYNATINTDDEDVLVMLKKEGEKREQTKRSKTLTLQVSRDRLRKRQDNDIETWVNRFAAWVNNRDHDIHKKYEGLVAAERCLIPSPQILYSSSDPDTRYHPPLYPTTWVSSDDHEEASRVKILGTTKAHIKKMGTGGLDKTPLYLGLHHAYVKDLFVLNCEEHERIAVYRPPKNHTALHRFQQERQGGLFKGVDDGTANDEPTVVEDDWKMNGDVIVASVVTFAATRDVYKSASNMRALATRKGSGKDLKADSGKQYLELFNGLTGDRLDLWVEKTDNWVQNDQCKMKWCSDKDGSSMFPCVHRWKNEGTLWEIERAPRKGVHFFIKKAAYKETGKDGTMAATNYPLSYKGDGQTRYLKVSPAYERTLDRHKFSEVASPGASVSPARSALSGANKFRSAAKQVTSSVAQLVATVKYAREAAEETKLRNTMSRNNAGGAPMSPAVPLADEEETSYRNFSSYFVTADTIDSEADKDACLWCVDAFPLEPDDVRVKRSKLKYGPNTDGKVPWWQEQACILDWVRYDKNREMQPKEIIDGEFVPVGLKWSASSESVHTSAVWQPATGLELLDRVQWYIDYWRVARVALQDAEFIDEDEDSAVKTKTQKTNQADLHFLDGEIATESHKMLIRMSPESRSPGCAGSLEAYLSLWGNYPLFDLQGVWTTDSFLGKSGAEYFRIDGATDGSVGYTGFLVSGETDIGQGLETFKVVQPVPIGHPVMGNFQYHGQDLQCFLEMSSLLELKITVAPWEGIGLDPCFTLRRCDHLKRDENSYFAIATTEYDQYSHTTWEIEPVHDIGTSIDTAVSDAVYQHQMGLQQEFRELVHGEMKQLLRQIIPNVLIDELGPQQLVQTLNYKIHSEAVSVEDMKKRGVYDYDPAKHTSLFELQKQAYSKVNPVVVETWASDVHNEQEPSVQRVPTMAMGTPTMLRNASANKSWANASSRLRSAGSSYNINTISWAGLARSKAAAEQANKQWRKAASMLTATKGLMSALAPAASASASASPTAKEEQGSDSDSDLQGTNGSKHPLVPRLGGTLGGTLASLPRPQEDDTSTDSSRGAKPLPIVPSLGNSMALASLKQMQIDADEADENPLNPRAER